MGYLKNLKCYDKKWLTFFLEARGVKVEVLIKFLGISRTTWQNKFYGRVGWYYEEVIIIKKILKLTDSELKMAFPHKP